MGPSPCGFGRDRDGGGSKTEHHERVGRDVHVVSEYLRRNDEGVVDGAEAQPVDQLRVLLEKLQVVSQLLQVVRSVPLKRFRSRVTGLDKLCSLPQTSSLDDLHGDLPDAVHQTHHPQVQAVDSRSCPLSLSRQLLS